MLPWIALTLALAPAAPSSFDAVADTAESVQNLGRLLDTYIGDCDHSGPEFDRRGCELKAAEVRKSYRGRRLRVQPSDLSGLLSLKGFDRRKQAFRLDLVPIFAPRGVAMSIGRPRKLDREGRPVIRTIPIWVKLPDGTPDFVFRRDLERGMVRMELIVQVQRGWQLKRGKEHAEGMGVKLLGLRLLDSRGGVLAEETR